jgi:glycosyltransferase involved in cell wall biosynthesis
MPLATAPEDTANAAQMSPGPAVGHTGRVLFLHFGQAELVPPVMHASSLLVERGWSVRIIALDDPEYCGVRAAADDRLQLVTLPAARPGLAQKALYARFLAVAGANALRWRPDWVYVSNPLAAPAGALVRLLAAARLVYHEHDAPAEAAGAFMRLCNRARARLTSRADLVVVPSAGRQDLLPPRDRELLPPLVVWNCPRRREALRPRPRTARRLRVIYQGSLGPDRLPVPVLEALAQLPGSSLRVVSYRTFDSDRHVRVLTEEAARLGVQVEFMRPVPRPDLFALCQECDVGLSLLPLLAVDPNVACAAGASNKAFDYLACGLPILVPTLPEWEELFVQPGYARACDPDDATSILAALRWFAEHPDEAAAMGERGRQKILADWNYESQFARVLSVLEA